MKKHRQIENILGNDINLKLFTIFSDRPTGKIFKYLWNVMRNGKIGKLPESVGEVFYV